MSDDEEKLKRLEEALARQQEYNRIHKYDRIKREHQEWEEGIYKNEYYDLDD